VVEESLNLAPAKDEDLGYLINIKWVNFGTGTRSGITMEGALANLGPRVTRATVANRRHGLDPAPARGRRSSWRTFLGAHWNTIAAIDFTPSMSGAGTALLP